MRFPKLESPLLLAYICTHTNIYVPEHDLCENDKTNIYINVCMSMHICIYVRMHMRTCIDYLNERSLRVHHMNRELPSAKERLRRRRHSKRF